MKIAIAGTGYVGLSNAVLLAQHNHVVAVDIVQENDCDFSYSKYSLIDENNIQIKKMVRIPSKLSYKKYLHHCFTGCLTVMYKKEFAKNIRSFDIKNNNDYGLFLQVVKLSKNALGLNEVMGYYRIRKNSISRNKIHKIKPYFKLMHDFLSLPSILVFCFLLSNILIGKFWKYEKYTTT